MSGGEQVPRSDWTSRDVWRDVLCGVAREGVTCRGFHVGVLLLRRWWEGHVEPPEAPWYVLSSCHS